MRGRRALDCRVASLLAMTAGPDRPVGSVPRPPYLNFLPRFLFSSHGSKPGYIVRAWLLTFLPSLLLSALVSSLAAGAEQPDLPTQGTVALLAIVLFAPAVETLLMAPPLLLLSRWLGAGPAVLLSAAGWAIVHSLAAPVWGLVVWWPFLILSIAFLTWRSVGLPTALLIAASIHALHNAAGAALLVGLG